MADRKIFTEEQKAEIVKKAEETSVTAASKEFGVSRAAIIKWRDSGKAKKTGEKVKEKAGKAKKDVKAAVKVAGAAVKETASETKASTKKAVIKVKEKKPQAQDAPKAEVIIQSPMGGNITPEEVLAKVGQVDQVYIRVDENKAYWVRGGETGSVDLW